MQTTSASTPRDRTDREQLGNFPSLTHLALISAAVNLDRQLG